jgi:hypothetical protein
MIIQNARELEVYQVAYASASSAGRRLGSMINNPGPFLISDL